MGQRWHNLKQTLRLAQYYAGLFLQEKANPAGPFNVAEGHAGTALAPPVDPDAILRATEIDPWAYVVTTTIAKSLSAAPLVVEARRTVDGDDKWVREDGGDLVRFTEEPNPLEPIDVLLWRTVLSLFTGNAYWVRDDIDEWQWYFCRPSIISPLANTDGDVVGYQIRDGEREVTLDPDDVIHFTMPSASKWYHGQSPMEPVTKQLLLNHHYATYLKDFFKNGALPTGELSSDQSLTPENISQTRKEWNRLHQGLGNHHRLAILGRGLSYNSISPPLADMVVDTLYKMPREAILAIGGVPPATAGILEYANYANSKEQKVMLWENGVMPIQRLIYGTLTLRLARPLGENYRFRFDVTNIKALQEDEESKAKRLAILVRNGIWTPNEAREETGREPVEGGDELSLLSTGEYDDTDDDVSGDEARGLESPVLARRHNAVAARGPRLKNYKVWESHHEKVTRLERLCQSLIQKYLDEQFDRVRDAMHALGNGDSFNVGLLYAWLQSKGDADDDANRIFDRTFEDAELEERVGPFVEDQVRRAGEQAVTDANIGLTFNVEEPEVQTATMQMVNRFKKINDTTYGKIKDTLYGVYQDQEGIDEAVRRLRETGSFSRDRAKRIAITEMNGIVNGGRYLGHKQTGATHKVWMSAFLHSSRPHHMAADGTKVRMSESFLIGSSRMKYPGDPSGRVEDVVNCHCTYTELYEDE